MAAARRRWLRLLPLFVAGAVLLGARAFVVSRLPPDSAEPLPVLGAVPAFRLTDQGNQPFGSDELDGKVWVASFIFTRCTTLCPTIIERVRAVDEWVGARPKLASRVRLVSVSVDPAHDTPARLGEFARDKRIDDAHGGRWRLLTGPAEALEEVVVRGFKLAVGPVEGAAAGAKSGVEVLHSSRLVLVDGARRIRGYYEDDVDGTRRLERDLARLADEAPPATTPTNTSTNTTANTTANTKTSASGGTGVTR